jgi:hypothetical protein
VLATITGDIPMHCRSALFLLMLTVLPSSPANADSCEFLKEASASSQNGRFHLEAKPQGNSHEWGATIEDKKTGATKRGSLGRQSFHPHFSILISDDGSRIILIEPSASDRDDHRVQFFDGDFKLLKEFGFSDLLMDVELADLKRSVSHVGFFVAPDPETGKKWWLGKDEKSFVIHLHSGRNVTIPLTNPRVAGGPSDPKVAFRTILKQSDDGPASENETVIRSEKEWKEFIDACSSPATRDVLRGEEVDFEKDMVIAVALGANSSHLGPNEEKQSGIQHVRSGEDGWVVDYNIVNTDVQDERPRYGLHVIKLSTAPKVSFRKGNRSIGG